MNKEFLKVYSANSSSSMSLLTYNGILISAAGSSSSTSSCSCVCSCCSSSSSSAATLNK